MLRQHDALDHEPSPIRGRIAVVGPCASGKSTLVERLRVLGYDARQCGQEHSGIHDMWRRITRPEILVFLDVSPRVALERRAMGFYENVVYRQHQRLAHARQHADLVIDTDLLTPSQVSVIVESYLVAKDVLPERAGSI